MITIAYKTNTEGFALAAAIRGLHDLWLTVNKTENFLLYELNPTRNELVGEWVDDEGHPTRRPYRRHLNSITTIEV